MRLSEQIADLMQHEILEDGIQAGKRLPTEVQLMERHGVSRTVIREAAQLLMSRGLVTVSPGRGMMVADFDGSIVAEQFFLRMRASQGSFAQLLQLRMAVEVQMTAAVAQTASLKQIESLQERVTSGRALIDNDEGIDINQFLESDIGFHELLSEVGGNPYFTLVCQPINHFLRDYYERRGGYPSDPRSTVEEHENILQAIRNGDTLAAHTAMDHHLTRLLRRWSMPGAESEALQTRKVADHIF